LREIRIRTARPEDIDAILVLEVACYPVLSTIAQWQRRHLESHQNLFPDGQFVAEAGDRIVGLCATFITRSDIALRPHTFREITGRGLFTNHDPAGETLYGAEIMVHPEFRRRGIARRFYEARFELVRRLGLHYFVAGGRMPGYSEVAGEVPAEEYVRDVVEGRRVDRVLSAQLHSGLQVARVLSGYLSDPKSGGYATLLVWENPEFAMGTTLAPTEVSDVEN